MQTRLAAKRDQEQASSELAQEASRGGDKPGRTDKAGQVQDRRDGRRSREQGGDAAQAAAAAASELRARSSCDPHNNNIARMIMYGWP